MKDKLTSRWKSTLRFDTWQLDGGLEAFMQHLILSPHTACLFSIGSAGALVF